MKKKTSYFVAGMVAILIAAAWYVHHKRSVEEAYSGMLVCKGNHPSGQFKNANKETGCFTSARFFLLLAATVMKTSFTVRKFSVTLGGDMKQHSVIGGEEK